MKIKYSIIIRVKNEERWITSCLQALFNQTIKNFEVIIVDNNSTDKTIQKALQFPVKIIKIDKFLPGKAINKGIKNSKGEIIVCLSGHCIPKDNKWLANLTKDLDKKNIAGVYGRQEPLSFSSPFDKRDLAITFGLDKKIQIKDYFFHNANSAFRKNTWVRFPFNEKITNIEDRDWGKRVINAKYKIIYEPKASVFHYHGIHQNLNTERAESIVKIMENIDGDKNKKYRKLENLKICVIIPFKSTVEKGKNDKLLNMTIKDAKSSKYVDNIFISSDNQFISSSLKMNKKFIKDIFLRPQYLNKEFVSIGDIINYTVKKIEGTYISPDLVVIMDPTHPFRPEGIVDNMLKKLIKNKSDSILAVHLENRNIWDIKPNEKIKINETNFIPREFKEKKSYISLFGLCFITNTKYIKDTSIYGKNVDIFEVNSPLSSIQIRDNYDYVDLKNILKDEKK